MTKQVTTRRQFLKATAGLGSLLMNLNFVHAVMDKWQNSLAPGKWQFTPSLLTSGAKTELKLKYTNGSESLPPGSYHKIRLEPLSVKAISDSSCSSDFKLQKLNAVSKIQIQAGGIDPMGFREIKIDFPDGLSAGESFSVAIGNEENDRLKALINPVPVDSLACQVCSDLYGDGREYDWFEFGWFYALPRADIKPAAASKIQLIAPSVISTEEKFDLHIAVTDQFGSKAYPPFEGVLLFEKNNGMEGLPEKTVMSLSDNGIKKLKDIHIANEGTYRIKAGFYNSDQTFESNPIVVKREPVKKIYWGSLHNHSWYSESWGNDIDDFFQFARDVSCLDFTAISDHINSTPEYGKRYDKCRLYRYRFGKDISAVDAFEHTVQRAEHYNEDNEFVTLIGYEWSSPDSGHYNIYFKEPFEHEKIFPGSGANLSEMQQLLENIDCLLIPHMHSCKFSFSSLTSGNNSLLSRVMPVIEAYSECGDFMHTNSCPDKCSGLSYLEALERGCKLGFVCDSNNHTGHPGRTHPASTLPKHRHTQGLTAIRSKDLSRESVFRAYRDHSLYGTTGERIYLEMKINDRHLGKKFLCDKPLNIYVRIGGTDFLEAVSLYEGNKLIETKFPGQVKDSELTFSYPKPSAKKRPLLIEVTQKNGHKAWTSPVWVEDTA